MEYYGTSFWAPTNTLSHFGIKGQKWGERHWQNADGTFNAAGKKRYFGNGGGENYKPVRSTGGNVRRAMAKVYEKNENFYSKHGNSKMAYMNKQVKDALLKEADEVDRKKEKQINDANKARNDAKSAKINNRTTKALERSKKFNDSINLARAKNDQRLEAKYNKKVESGKMTKEKAAERLNDFRKGTKMVESGQKKYDSVIKNYGDTRIKALSDPSYKKTTEYKNAGKEYLNLKISDAMYSQSYTKLVYASRANPDD